MFGKPSAALMKGLRDFVCRHEIFVEAREIDDGFIFVRQRKGRVDKQGSRIARSAAAARRLQVQRTPSLGGASRPQASGPGGKSTTASPAKRAATMSIYATLWHLRFPREGEADVDGEWIDVLAQGVPGRIGTPTPGYGYSGMTTSP